MPPVVTGAYQTLGPICRLGGAFFAVYHQNIYPGSSTVTDSVAFMLYYSIRGLDDVLGPVLGAFLLVTSFELPPRIQLSQALIYVLLLISCMLWLPNGLLSLSLGSERKEPSPRPLASPQQADPAICSITTTSASCTSGPRKVV